MKIKTSRRWLRRGAGGGVLAVAALIPSFAGASTPGQHPDWIVPGTDLITTPDYLPDSFYDDMRGCPAPSEFPTSYAIQVDEHGDQVVDEHGNPVPDLDHPRGPDAPNLCVKLTAHSGQLKIGGTEATVDPIEVYLGVALSGTIVIGSDTSGGGAVAPIRIPGGILGIAELDPLLALDTIGLLNVSATPEMGAASVGAPGEDPVSAGADFLIWLGDGSYETTTTLNMPLSIRLNNLLLGSNCRIPEFNIGLTNGTTAPPEGVEPLTGSQGEFARTNYQMGSGFAGAWNTRTGNLDSRINAQFNDNAFAVPGAADCDPLGALDPAIDQVDGLLGGTLGSLGLGTGNGLFDPVVDLVAGLPSPAGNNYAKFKIDFQDVPYPKALIDGRAVSDEPLSFGDVPVGASATKTLTIGNEGSEPFDVMPTNISIDNGGHLTPAPFASNADQWALDMGTCEGASLAQGETCEVSVKFSPTSTGGKNTFLRLTSGGYPTRSLVIRDSQIDTRGVPVSGAGVEPAPEAPAQVTVTPAPNGGAVVAATPPARRCTKLFGLTVCL